jgi:hypothetical protein
MFLKACSKLEVAGDGEAYMVTEGGGASERIILRAESTNEIAG